MRTVACWTDRLSPTDSLDIYRDIALKHAELAGPLKGRLVSLIRADKIRELCELVIDVNDPLWVPEELFHARQCQAFFTKIEPLDVGIDKEKVAYEAFVTSERVCKDTNTIFRAWKSGTFCFTPEQEAFLYDAQLRIGRVLGPCPRLGDLDYRFGRGATTKTKKSMASLREKFRAGAACSEELFPAVSYILGEIPTLTKAWASAYTEDEEELWASVPVEIHDGRLEFVPKSYKTHRGVVVEPVLNGMAQMAIGDIMTQRLRKAGIDISDQTLNQRLAKEGSLTGDLATLDLSAASDSIAIELVYHLLPPDWAELLARARTGHVTYAGKRYTLEKFSSMGNGFTFPLETLIFWGLTRAVCGSYETVSVYGDDIICPSGHFDKVSKLLWSVGFTVNEKKSFHEGPFRESCGSDWYFGYAVRPHYPRDWVSGRSLFLLHNFYKRRGMEDWCGWVVDKIHPATHLWGPDGYGDGHLIGEYPKRYPSQGRGFAGHRFSTYTQLALKDIRPQMLSDYVLPAYSVYQRGTRDNVHLQKSFDPFTSIDVTRRNSFLRMWRSGHGEVSYGQPLSELPFESGPGKATSLPGTDADSGYKRIDVYIL
jgi:hypothetical protein